MIWLWILVILVVILLPFSVLGIMKLVDKKSCPSSPSGSGSNKCEQLPRCVHGLPNTDKGWYIQVGGDLEDPTWKAGSGNVCYGYPSPTSGKVECDWWDEADCKQQLQQLTLQK